MDSLPSRAGQEGFDRLAPVAGAAIPDDQQPHRDVGGQLLQEPRRISTPEGAAGEKSPGHPTVCTAHGWLCRGKETGSVAQEPCTLSASLHPAADRYNFWTGAVQQPARVGAPA